MQLSEMSELLVLRMFVRLFDKFENFPSPTHLKNQIRHKKTVVPSQRWGPGWI